MKFIKITNNGIIDSKSFTIIGASTKTNKEGFIGQWGSGLKYAIAYLLRNKIPFKVYSDYNEVKFSIQTEQFRDKSIDIVCVNGEKTSISTELGFDNTQWTVIREIFSNAIDEGDAKLDVVESDLEDLKPVEDCTCFYIQADTFKEILDNWDLYFSNERTDILYHDKNFNQIYTGGENLLVYRKGIRCHFAKGKKALFNYDLTWVEINESRVIASDWDFRYGLVGFLRKISDKSIIHRILYNINGSWENSLDWSNSSYNPFTDTWLKEVGDKYLIPCENAGFWEEEIKYLKERHIILPNSLIQALKIQFGDKVKCIGDDATKGGSGDKKLISDLSKREQHLLDESLTFLSDAGYEVKYPIKVCKFVSPVTLGQSLEDTIFLSDKVFTMGKREIINTIIEENHHLVTGFEDETRNMQTSLINLSISLMEEKLGIYL